MTGFNKELPEWLKQGIEPPFGKREAGGSQTNARQRST